MLFSKNGRRGDQFRIARLSRWLVASGEVRYLLLG
jgi:hypothetical protein